MATRPEPDSAEDREEAGYEPTSEEAAELDAAVAEASSGGGVPAQDFLRQLRATPRWDLEKLSAAPDEDLQLAEAGLEAWAEGETLDRQ